MNLRHLFLFSSLLVLLTGCFKDDAPTTYQDVEGVVLSNGQEVANAQIHIRNHFNPGGFITGTEQSNGFPVQFTASVPGLYTGVLFRYASEEILATFYEDTLESGQHTLIIPDSLLSNGVFGYEVKTNIGTPIINLFIVAKPDTSLPGLLPFTTTNASGEFTLDAGQAALGQTFGYSTGTGLEVNDSLQIIVTDQENVLKKVSVEVKPEQANFFEITLD